MKKNKNSQVIIEVDERILRSQRTGDESFSVQDAIENEFGWLHESGIYLMEIKKLSQEKKNKEWK